MIHEILNNVPDYWHRTTNICKVKVSQSDELIVINKMIKKALNEEMEVESLVRHQNLYTYGQFLIRKQALVQEGSTYYEVRRFIVIPKSREYDAVKSNLDVRRFQPNSRRQLLMCSDIDNFDVNSDCLLVISIVTNNPNEKYFEPQRSSDYYIEYVATLKDVSN